MGEYGNAQLRIGGRITRRQFVGVFGCEINSQAGGDPDVYLEKITGDGIPLGLSSVAIWVEEDGLFEVIVPEALTTKPWVVPFSNGYIEALTLVG